MILRLSYSSVSLYSGDECSYERGDQPSFPFVEKRDREEIFLFALFSDRNTNSVMGIYIL